MIPYPAMQFIAPVFSPQVSDPKAAVQAEFGRLVHAAIINSRFRQMLLTNPQCTIEKGYFGESFHFSNEMKEQINHIRVGTLEEFSSQVLQIVDAPSFAEMAVLHYQ
ncbi:MAG TPA: hypothetical protein VF338_12890 [Leptolinea sp.]